MAHGFRYVPKDRKHAPEYYRLGYVPRFESFYPSMPVLKFEPFTKTIVDAPYNDAELAVFRAIKRGELSI